MVGQCSLLEMHVSGLLWRTLIFLPQSRIDMKRGLIKKDRRRDKDEGPKEDKRKA